MNMHSIRCCVPKCQSTSLIFHHRFPKPDKHKERFEKWLELINNDELFQLEPEAVYNNKRVCRLHFDSKYFSPGCNRLHNNAVPTSRLVAGTDFETDHSYALIPGSSINSSQTDTPYFTEAEHTSVMLKRYFETDHSYALIPGSSTNSSHTDTPYSTEAEHTSVMPKRVELLTPHNILKKCGVSTPKDRTPRKNKMYLEIKRMYRKYNAVNLSKTSYKRRLFEARKFAVNENLEEKLERFNAMAALFIRCQFREVTRSKRLHRFTLEEKFMALSLYKHSRKTYQFLSSIFVLPSRSTIERLTNKINIGPGINASVFDALTEVAKRMDDDDKFIAVLFDEMSIMPSLAFNEQKGIIEGFEDIMGQRTKYISDHVLMFMIRSIKSNKKAPVSYNFTSRGGAKTQQIKPLLIEIIEKLISIGFKPITVICDQVGNNFSAIKSIMKDTEESYKLEHVSYTGGFFEVAGLKVYPLLDPPHLIKGIRNNLIKKNVKFSGNKVAKWIHIQNLYEEDTGCAITGLRVLPHLTEEHIYEPKLRKMKVKHAVQIFSQRVASTLMLASKIDNGLKIGTGASDTAELLLFFDRLFDSVNGGRKKAQKGKILRCGLSETSEHIKFWTKEALPLLSTMEFVRVKPRDQKRPPSLRNWTFTIENVMKIWEILKCEGFKYILPRNLNQDPLENFFGRVRGFGGLYMNPSPSMCIGIFKALFINFSCSLHKKTFNCQDDESENFLMPLKFFYKSEAIGLTEHLEVSSESESTLLQPQLKTSIVTLTQKLSTLAKHYVAGFILKKVKKTVLTCATCSDSLFYKDPNLIAEHELIQSREYGNGWHQRLCYPTIHFVNCFYDIVTIIHYHLHANPYSNNLVLNIKHSIQRLLNFELLLCTEHRVSLSEQICQLIIRTILHNWCKDVNKKLKGTDSRTYLGNNQVMKQALEIRLKSLKKKKIKKPENIS